MVIKFTKGVLKELFTILVMRSYYLRGTQPLTQTVIFFAF